jgi:hypothetical protein
MKIVIGLVGCMLCIASLKAAPGDTLKVQTFTFGSKQDSTITIPDAAKDYQKIQMY